MKYLSILLISSLLVLSCNANKSKNQSEQAVEAKTEVVDSKPKIGETVTLPSGLKYKILQYGIGDSPRATSRVKTHYHGTLEDGTVFDSSYDRGQPLTFGVNQVIKGWQEALQLMKVGSIWELTVPPNLGYGSRPAGKIPAFSTLTFKVELLEIL